MSNTTTAAATPANWDDDKLSETFSDAFSDAFQVPLRQVRKNVLDRLSGRVANGAGTKGVDAQQLHTEQFEGWKDGGIDGAEKKKIEPSIAVVEQVNSLAMSYSSNSDATHGREARDDFAELGAASSEDTSTAAPTTASDASTTTKEVKSETKEDSTTAVTTGGMRQRLHQRYKQRVTEAYAKKNVERTKIENSAASVAHDVKMSRRNKASERLVKSRERLINRRHGGVQQESVTRDDSESPPPPPPPPPLPPHRLFHAIAANVTKEASVDIACTMRKIEFIAKRHQSTHQNFTTVSSNAVASTASTDSGEQHLTLLANELDNLKAQIDAEVERSNDMIMILEANLEATKIDNNSLLHQLHELNEALTFSKAEKQCLADKMEDLIDKLSTVKAEKATLQYTADGINTANQKLAQAAAELKQNTKILGEKVAMLEGEKKNIEARLKEKEALLLELKDSAQTFNDALESKNGKIKEFVEESSKLRVQIRSLEGSVSILQEDITKKQKTVEDAAAFSASLKEEVSRSSTQVVTLTKEAEELRKFKADAEVRIDLLQSTMTEYSHQFIALEAKLEESQAARACLEDEKTNLKESNAELVQRLAAASAENDEKDAAIEDMSNQADAAMEAAINRSRDLESQVAMLQRRLQESMVQSSKFEEENRDLKNRLFAVEKNAEMLLQQNTESDDLVVELESRVLDMIVENRKITTSKEELQSKVETVTKERDFAQATVMELMSGNKKTAEMLETLQSEKDELSTKLDEAEKTFKACESEKLAHLNASAVANREKERETAKLGTELAAMSANALELEGKVDSLTADLNLSKSELEETKAKLESALSRSKMLELEYRTTMGMLEVTKGDKEKVAADLLEALNGVITSSNDRERESSAHLTALTTEKDELANKVLTITAELNEMHALVKTLKAEKSSALAKVNDLVIANATVFESKVNEVSCRLDSEFAQSQQQMDKLNAEIAELQGANWRLTKENTQLHSDKKIAEARAAKLEETKALLEESNSQLKVGKAMAEIREASLKETSAALKEIKAAKRLTTWSSFASVSQTNSKTLNEERASRPMSPASSCTSGSDFVDPTIAEQVNKALDWARSRRNLPKG
eukprot:scaffold11063_cov116-Skeletonema_menzelii.AAC.5